MGCNHISLTTLMESDSKACDYYNSLPEHIKEKIKSDGENIDSFESLKNYAQNLLRG
ncbi:MAG: hypothetical protein IKL42_06980 [Clostridia bacterium]|nr:hypothetical protein [Clostridia bacterium]MBR2878761.1 hypothetical protein [Clostridia bacterium]MBR3577126.1 hypothetical protein [Clostridia bacterium]